MCSVSLERANQFKKIYKSKIDDFSRKIERQFKSISPLDSKTKIEIVEKGTKMSLMRTTNAEGQDEIIYTLTIGYEEINMMYENSNMDLFECFCKIVTHEYLHVLCGHFDYGINRDLHSLAINGEDKERCLYRPSLLKIFLAKTNKNDLNKHKEINQSILNIAGDFEINNLLDIGEPFIRARMFGLPEGLQTTEYYLIVYHVLNSFERGKVKLRNFESSGISNHISDYFSYARNDLLNLFESMGSDSEGMLGDLMGNNECFDYRYRIFEKYEEFTRSQRYGKLQGNVSNYIRKMTISKTGIWKSFNDILNSLMYSVDYKLSFVDKIPSWTKYNSRKDGIGLMYPGKYEVDGAIERKFKNRYALFVDISASMDEVIEPLFTFCYYALSKMDLDLIFYDTEIKYVFNKSSEIKLEPFTCGGTNTLNAVKQYEERFRKPTKIFILTDGYDSTIKQVKSMYDAKVWQISRNHIKELGD